MSLLKEGLYGVGYRVTSDTAGFCGSGLAAVRNGRILGTDHCGTAFIGAYEYDTEKRVNRFNVRLTVMPERELVTGLSSGREGATIELAGDVESSPARSEVTIDIAGEPVAVTFTYIGPLPR